MNAIYIWEIEGIYRATNENILTIERSAASNWSTRNLTKRSIISRDFILTQAGWKRDADKVTDIKRFKKLTKYHTTNKSRRCTVQK